MADKKKIISLEVDTGSSKQDLASLGDGFKQVNREAGQLDATFEDIYGEMKPLTGRMGELEDRLYELAQAGDTTSNEFKTLANEVGRLRQVQQETDRTTDALAQTTSQKLGGSMRFAAGTMQTAVGGMAAFGIESEKGEKAIAGVVGAMAVTDGLETMNESYKSVRALGKAIKSSTIFQKAATAAQWLWNVALNANPLGLIVAAVAALVAAGYGLLKLFQFLTADTEDYAAANAKAGEELDKTSKELDKNREALKKNADEVARANKHELDLARAKGATKEELRALERAQLASNITTAEGAVKTAESTKKDLEKVLSLRKRKLAEQELAGVEDAALESAKENVKKAEENLKQGVTDVKNAIATKNQAHLDQMATTRRYEVEDAQATTNANKAELDKQKAHNQKKLDEKKAAAEKETERLNKQLEDTQALIDKNTQERLDKDKSAEELATEKQNTRNTQILDALKESLENKKVTQEQYDALVEEQEANHLANMTQIATDGLITKNEAIKAILDEVPVEQKPLNELSPEELEEREEKELSNFDAEQEARLKKLEDLGADEEAMTALKEQGESARAAIEKKYSDENIRVAQAERDAKLATMDAISGGLQAVSGALEKGSKEQKALALAAALINTYVGISNVWKEPEPGTVSTNLATRIAATATVAASGFAAVKNIANTKVSKDSNPSAGGGSFNSVSGAQAQRIEAADSRFDAVGNEQVGRDAQAQANADAQSNNPVRAYVTSTDVASGAQFERNRVEVAGF